MAKHSVLEFNKKLKKLFDERTFWLKKAIDKGSKGRPPRFDRKKLSNAIKDLQIIATDTISSSFAKKEFKKLTKKQKKQWHVKNKGWGWRDKKRKFDKWFEENINHPNCIYVFWSRTKCIYVGRTIRGKGRPQNHFNKSFFPSVTRIDIFATSSPSQVPKLECLAIHRFYPKENGMKASFPKRAKKCPVCKIKKNIRSELKQIFSFRK